MARRRRIVSGLVSGAASWRVSRRAPAAVTVRSMTASSAPSGPEAEESTSRPRRVGASIFMVSPNGARRGGSGASGSRPVVD